MDDTIAAISTPFGSGGIGIIRISGRFAFGVAEKLFRGNSSFYKIKSHSVSFGKIIDPSDGGTVDEVLLTKMNAPKTFTREDVVEINCHGGIVVLRRILDLVFAEGVYICRTWRVHEKGFFKRQDRPISGGSRHRPNKLQDRRKLQGCG